MRVVKIGSGGARRLLGKLPLERIDQPSTNLDSMSDESVLDVTGTLARLGGDQQLFCEILEFVLEDSPPLMAQLRRAAEVPDAAAIRSTAHALSGLLAGCGGVRAAQAARQIEDAAAVGGSGDLARLLRDLESEVERLIDAIFRQRDRRS
jgi:HPt (histidine-containing phosphotransfer) domain-containing protein